MAKARHKIEALAVFFFFATLLMIYLTFLISGAGGLIQLAMTGISDPRTIIAVAIAMIVGAIIAHSHYKNIRFGQ